MVAVPRVWEALQSVTDPEYPLSVVDLGMVYRVTVDGDVVHIDMTFTSIGCPAIEMIIGDVRDAVLSLPEVRDVHVDIVWAPPWTKDMITERGRRVLQMFGVVN